MSETVTEIPLLSARGGYYDGAKIPEWHTKRRFWGSYSTEPLLFTLIRKYSTESDLDRLRQSYESGTKPKSFNQNKAGELVRWVFDTYYEESPHESHMSIDELLFIKLAMRVSQKSNTDQRSGLPRLFWPVAAAAAVVLTYNRDVGLALPVDYENARMAPFGDSSFAMSHHTCITEYAKAREPRSDEEQALRDAVIRNGHILAERDLEECYPFRLMTKQNAWLVPWTNYSVDQVCKALIAWTR